MEKKKNMSVQECINILEMECELQLFNPSTGETYDEDSLEYDNELNRDCYYAHKTAIELLKTIN